MQNKKMPFNLRRTTGNVYS